MAATLFERVWDAHVVRREHDGPALLYVDLHLIHEVTSPQAFEGLRLAGRGVRRPDRSLATMDHNVPTVDGPVTDPLARAQLDALRRNCEEFGVPLYATGSGREGIVHVIGPGSVGTLWSIVATVSSGRRTFRPARRRPSNACADVISWRRCRSM